MRIDPDRSEVPRRGGELLGGEPGSRVGAHRVEGDVAEIEQPGVADDDVQADGHHDEDEHVDAGRDVRPHAEHRHREHLVLVEGIEDGEEERRGRVRRRAVFRRHPAERESDRQQRGQRPRPGGQEDDDECGLRREPIRERWKEANPVERPDGEGAVRERVVDEVEADREHDDPGDREGCALRHRERAPPAAEAIPDPDLLGGRAGRRGGARVGHPPSGVRSPRRPSGRNTRIKIRIVNTIDSVQSEPGACQFSPSLNA